MSSHAPNLHNWKIESDPISNCSRRSKILEMETRIGGGSAASVAKNENLTLVSRQIELKRVKGKNVYLVRAISLDLAQSFDFFFESLDLFFYVHGFFFLSFFTSDVVFPSSKTVYIDITS